MVWESFNWHWIFQSVFPRHLMLNRRRTSINADRFPKRAPKNQASRGVREKLFWISFPKRLLTHPDKIFTVCQNHLTDFNLENFFVQLKIYLSWKIWPISIKQWKPVWIRACWKQTDFQYLPCSICQSFSCKRGESCRDSIFLATQLFEDTSWAF